jgi:hypothetical protein
MPPHEPLPPDPESLEKWRQLPHNRPSREALPPAAGGLRLATGLLIVFALLIILALIFQGRPV